MTRSYNMSNKDLQKNIFNEALHVNLKSSCSSQKNKNKKEEEEEEEENNHSN